VTGGIELESKHTNYVRNYRRTHPEYYQEELRKHREYLRRVRLPEQLKRKKIKAKKRKKLLDLSYYHSRKIELRKKLRTTLSNLHDLEFPRPKSPWTSKQIEQRRKYLRNYPY
jgi:hypothetical protein